MLTATPDIIRDDFITQIQAINPEYPGYQHIRWDHAFEGDVQGRLRRFRIDQSMAVPQQDDVLHSRGEQYTYIMQIVTAYEGLGPQDVNVIQQDGVDLRKALEPRVGVLPGLLKPRLDSIEVATMGDDGRPLQATFIWTIDYLHDTGLGN